MADTVLMNPECRDGKHHNCDDTGLDTVTDEITICPCPCHELIAS